MKLIGCLLFISCCMTMARADEFKIDVSSDLIEAYSQPITELETPVLQKVDNQLPDDIKPGKTAPTPQSSESESIKKQQSNPSQSIKASNSPNFLHTPKQKQSMKNLQQVQGLVDYSQSNPLAVDSNLGFYPNQFANQNPGYDDFIGEIHDELRLMVGEEVYAKMVWTYLDIKRLDNWIYETTSQLALFSQQTLGSEGIVGLSNQLKADLFFLGLMGSDSGRITSAPPGGRIDAIQAMAVAEQVNQVVTTGTVLEGKFFGILKYLTILNFVYLILTVIALIYTAKLFNFLVKQQ